MRTCFFILALFLHFSPSFSQSSVSQYFFLSKAQIKNKLLKERELTLISEDSQSLMYLIETSNEDKVITSEEMVLYHFNDKGCYQVVIMLKKDMMNETIKKFDEQFVRTEKYHWIDYENETKWKLVRLEKLVTRGIFWERFFGLVASPLN